jgi:hypothetical protein
MVCLTLLILTIHDYVAVLTEPFAAIEKGFLTLSVG